MRRTPFVFNRRALTSAIPRHHEYALSTFVSRFATTARSATLGQCIVIQQKRFSSSSVSATATTGTPQEKPSTPGKSLSECKVAFACGRSAELTAKLAAMEAFDVASSALPRAPNLCIINVSIDCADMVDCLPIVWSALERAQQQQNQQSSGAAAAADGSGRPSSNGAPRSGSANAATEEAATSTAEGDAAKAAMPPMVMIGSVVRDQRFNGGFCEVVLGCVPDLQVTTFTLDKVPESFPDTLPPPALGIAMVDWRLSVAHLKDVNDRLDATSRLLNSASKNSAPLVGAVLPPAESTPSKEGSEDRSTQAPPADALFCINDAVYRGSAAVAVLHSSMLSVDALTATPCNEVPGFEATRRVTDGAIDGPSLTWTISAIDGRPATDVIKEVYEGEFLNKRLSSRLFVAVHLRDAGIWAPLTFRGIPDVQSIVATLPPAVHRALAQQMTRDGADAQVVKLVCDARQMDTPSIASALLGYEKDCLNSESGNFVSERQRVVVHREQSREVVAANACMLHWFHPGLYEVMSDDPTLAPNAGSDIFIRQTADEGRHVPSVAFRCLGQTMPVAGLCTPGQIGPFVVAPNGEANTTSRLPPAYSSIGARCASHVVIREKAADGSSGVPPPAPSKP